MGVRSPERLHGKHRLDGFVCRHSSLTQWLQRRALQNQALGASNCFVVCSDAGDGLEVVGYYALAAGSLDHRMAVGRIRRNMPDPIPVAVLGRLAVHSGWTGQGIGAGLLKDAILRCIKVAGEGPGVRAMLCHAIDDDARGFYLRHGFMQSPVAELTMMLGLVELARGMAP